MTFLPVRARAALLFWAVYLSTVAYRHTPSPTKEIHHAEPPQ